MKSKIKTFLGLPLVPGSSSIPVFIFLVFFPIKMSYLGGIETYYDTHFFPGFHPSVAFCGHRF
jgi:hypothetical protein